MKDSQKEDYRLLATVSINKTSETVEDVICKVYLPKRTTEIASLVLIPNDEQNEKLRPAHFLGLRAELIQPSGDINVITSNQALITRHKSTRFGPTLSENSVSADAWDLQVETYFRPVHADVKPEGHFWLSRNRLLSNVWEHSFSFTGEVSVGKSDPLKVTLSNAVEISFTEHSRYRHLDRDDTLMYGENVAELNIAGDSLGTILEDSLPHLEDLLRLVSFVGEYRCTCVGWSADDSERAIDVYRSRRIPTQEPPSFHDALLDYSGVGDFLRAGYGSVCSD